MQSCRWQYDRSTNNSNIKTFEKYRNRWRELTFNFTKSHFEQKRESFWFFLTFTIFSIVACVTNITFLHHSFTKHFKVISLFIFKHTRWDVCRNLEMLLISIVSTPAGKAGNWHSNIITTAFFHLVTDAINCIMLCWYLPMSCEFYIIM